MMAYSSIFLRVYFKVHIFLNVKFAKILLYGFCLPVYTYEDLSKPDRSKVFSIREKVCNEKNCKKCRETLFQQLVCCKIINNQNTIILVCLKGVLKSSTLILYLFIFPFSTSLLLHVFWSFQQMHTHLGMFSLLVDRTLSL